MRCALAKGTAHTFDASLVTTSTYRPSNKQNVYFAPLLYHERAQLLKMFLTAAPENVEIVVTSPTFHPPSRLTLWMRPGLHTLDTNQFFPRYVCKPRSSRTALFCDEYDFVRVDNISDEILTDYRHRDGANVSEKEVFFSYADCCIRMTTARPTRPI